MSKTKKSPPPAGISSQPSPGSLELQMGPLSSTTYSPPPPLGSPASSETPPDLTTLTPPPSETAEKRSSLNLKNTSLKHVAATLTPSLSSRPPQGDLDRFVWAAANCPDDEFRIAYGRRVVGLWARYGKNPAAAAGLARLSGA